MFARKDFESDPGERIHGGARRKLADGRHGQLDEATWKRRLDDGAKEMGVELDESQLDMLWRYARCCASATST